MAVKVNMKPTSVIKVRLGINHKGPVHKFFTNTCALHMDKYVPFRTGALAETVVVNGKVTSNVSEDEIVYAQKYARIVYDGVRKGKPLNYRTDKHKLAGPYWDKRMWTAEKDKIIEEVQDYIRTRGGK